MTPEELATFADATIDDLLWPDLKLLIVGVNPGLWTAAVNAPFARPGNRFWPAMHRAGVFDRTVDASRGLSEVDRSHIRDRGVGMTNLVARATARADELTTAELTEAPARIERIVADTGADVVAILGVTSYRTAYGRRRARLGRQDDGIGDAELWVVPNPSGLNAHETIDSLAVKYRAAAKAAGVVE